MSSDNVIYVLKERGRNDIVKIGKAAGLAKTRFRQNAFLNPRLLEVVAMWRVGSVSEARSTEIYLHSKFGRYPLKRANEWFFSSAEDAVERIAEELGRGPDYHPLGPMPFSVEEIYASPDPWDDMREKGEYYRPERSEIKYLVQRRIWLHYEEDGPYSKFSYNTWWMETSRKTTNGRCFTFNPYDVAIGACLAVEVDPNATDWKAQILAANQRTKDAWEEAVRLFGERSTPAGKVGWTVTPKEEIVKFFTDKGFSPLALDASKNPKGIKSLNYPPHG